MAANIRAEWVGTAVLFQHFRRTPRQECKAEQEGMTAKVLMAAPCTNSLGCESGGHKHGGDEGRMAGSNDDDVEVS